MKFGLNDRHYAMVDQGLFQPLKAAGVSVWVFGSRARGKHHPFSDLDVLYDSKGSTATQAQISAIREKLENSMLPVKVDLVSIEDLAESYRDSVMRDRVAV